MVILDGGLEIRTAVLIISACNSLSGTNAFACHRTHFYDGEPKGWKRTRMDIFTNQTSPGLPRYMRNDGFGFSLGGE